MTLVSQDLMAADGSEALTEHVKTLLGALTSAVPSAEVDSNLLRQILLSTTSANPADQQLGLKDIQTACQVCSKMFTFLEQAGQSTTQQITKICSKQAAVAGFQIAPGVMQLLHTSYTSAGIDAASLQPHILQATATFLKLARVALLSTEFLQLTGSDVFAATAAAVRAAVKDNVVPLLCSLATQASHPSGMAILEPYEQLLSIGRSSADIIAGRLQGSQAKELRSFAVLNLAWSGIVKLLLVLADMPDRPRLTKSFHVLLLLQLLTGYVQYEFDILMQRQELNQLKVVRFWAQHVIKLATTFSEVSQRLWSPIAAMVAHMHEHMPLIRDPASDTLQNICQEVQQHLLSRLGNLVAACVPECPQGDRNIAPWVQFLGQETNTDKKTAHNAVESVWSPGKLMTALDILKHARMLSPAAQLQCAEHLLPLVLSCTCKHLHARATTSPALRAAIAQAMLVFMAVCCSNRDSLEAWHQCEVFLFKQAMQPNPIRQHLLAAVWSAVLRQSSADVAQSHAHTLHKTVMTVAHSCGARQSGHELVGQTLAQLVQLTAHLLMATHLELRQHLCQSMLQAATGNGSVNADNASFAVGNSAALAATLRIMQLASSASEPVLPSGVSMQLLQTINEAAGQSAKQTLHMLMTCMAEAVSALKASGRLDDSQQASQSFQIAADLVAKADSTDTWAAPALHVLFLLKDKLDAGRLADLLPALLRLQHTDQAAPFVAALASCYAEAQAPPIQLFHAVLEEQHWALQHEAMESLLVYIRSPKSGDFKQVLPRSLYNPDKSEGRASPFIALLKQYMQRNVIPSKGPALSNPECCELETRSVTALTQTAQLVAQQPTRSKSLHTGTVQQGLKSSIAKAVQALQRVHHDVERYLPEQAEEHRAEVHQQLSLLAQIAQSCVSGA